MVRVSPDFTPDTIDRALGVRSARLQVVAQALDAQAPSAPAPSVAPAPAPARRAGARAGSDRRPRRRSRRRSTRSRTPAPARTVSATSRGTPSLRSRRSGNGNPAGSRAETAASALPTRSTTTVTARTTTGGAHRRRSGPGRRKPRFPPASRSRRSSWTTTPDGNGNGNGNGSWAPAPAEATELAGVAPDFPYRALDDPADTPAPAAPARRTCRRDRAAAAEADDRRQALDHREGRRRGIRNRPLRGDQRRRRVQGPLRARRIRPTSATTSASRTG